jgi:hypothetical protein
MSDICKTSLSMFPASVPTGLTPVGSAFSFPATLPRVSDGEFCRCTKNDDGSDTAPARFVPKKVTTDYDSDSKPSRASDPNGSLPIQ